MEGILDFSYMLQSLPEIAKGIPVSLAIAAVAFLAGCVIGLAAALIKIFRIPVLRQIAAVYVSFTRGTPLLVQIFLSYYGIPILLRWINERYGLSWDISFIPAIYYMYVVFALNSGAYLSETIRSAIQSVDRGQMEACYSVGMTTAQGLSRIILPQALRTALPGICNHFVSLLKDTSLAFAASVPEIIGQAKIIGGRTSQFFEVYIVAAALYWILCIGFERLAAYWEKRSRRYERGNEG